MPWPWPERPLDSKTWSLMIGGTDLKQAPLTGRKERMAAEQTLQNGGRGGCHRLRASRAAHCFLCAPSLFRQTRLDAVSFLSHSHIECRSFPLLATPTPIRPSSLQIHPERPVMLLQARWHEPWSKSTHQSHLRRQMPGKHKRWTTPEQKPDHLGKT